MVDVAIIGGGPSGMVAALAATARGVSVCLLEKSARVGRKLLATGNGRCNLSNVDLSFHHYHGSAAETLLPAVFKTYGQEEVAAFWENLGIELIPGEEGKLYPRSLQASSVLNALRHRMEEQGVQVRTDAKVTEIRQEKEGGYRLRIQHTEGGADSLKAKAIILCTGGKAYPRLGSAGEGYALAKSLGLTVTQLRPALCRLLNDHPRIHELAGIKVEADLQLSRQGKMVAEKAGEVLFTDKGISGPPVLQLSRDAGEGLIRKEQVTVTIDFAPEWQAGALFAHLTERMQRLSSWTAEEALESWLGKRVGAVLLKEIGVSLSAAAGTLNKRQIGDLARMIKGWELTIAQLDGYEEAQVTIGGLAAKEFDENLMCKRYPGLFAAGEVLDLDGDCGGYNLQWATGSGLLCGEKAAAYCISRKGAEA